MNCEFWLWLLVSGGHVFEDRSRGVGGRLGDNVDVARALALVHLEHTSKLRIYGCNHTWRSDWDPTTSLMYIVREDHDLNQTILPFDPTDEPAIERTESEVRIKYRWLH